MRCCRCAARTAGGTIDLSQVVAALEHSHVDDARVLDLKQESDALYDELSGGGHSFLIGGLSGADRAAADRAAFAAAGGARAGAAGAGGAHRRRGARPRGVQLTILHLVGMLLIVAVGSNYALFFDRQANSEEAGDAALTLASLVIANASTVIGFGLLSFSQVPVLVALGTTVAPGTFLALLFAAIGASGRRSAHA